MRQATPIQIQILKGSPQEGRSVANETILVPQAMLGNDDQKALSDWVRDWVDWRFPRLHEAREEYNIRLHDVRTGEPFSTILLGEYGSLTFELKAESNATTFTRFTSEEFSEQLQKARAYLKRIFKTEEWVGVVPTLTFNPEEFSEEEAETIARRLGTLFGVSYHRTR